MSLPYMPLYVDDYEADTAHLSLVEDGIYNRLLRLCWRSPKCQMPHDHDWIARKIRVSNDEERGAMENILGEFFTVRRGRVFSKRLRDEFVRISASVSKRKKAGKSGGVAKHLKNKETDPSNARAMLKHPEPEPYKEPNGSFKRASARKKSGFVKPRNAADAAVSFIEEMNHEQGREIENREGTGGNVQLLSAVGNRRA